MRAKSKKEKYDKIMEKKMTTTISYLCQDLPKQFGDILLYIRNLDFTSEPDYQLIQNKFQEIINEHQIIIDYDYDWKKIPDYDVV